MANESEAAAWFDDIEIAYTPDLITQETHYDPWGLELIGIGEQGNPECKWKFQDKELEDALGLFWADFGARQYDAQLGRWHSIDPADQFASGYTGMGNNPVMGVDPDGRWVHIVVGAAIGGIVNVATHWNRIDSFGDGLAAFGIGAAGGAVIAATGGAAAGAVGLSASGMGVLSGAVTGAVGSAFGAPVTGLGNALYFGDEYSPSQWGKDVMWGGAVAGGASALIKGANFWTGDPRASGAGAFDLKNRSLLGDDGWQRGATGRWTRGMFTVGDATGMFPDGKGFIQKNPFAGLEFLDDGARMVGQPFAPRGISNMPAFLSSAMRPGNSQGLSNAGIQLQSHINRSGASAFSDIPFSHKTANDQALKIINNILNSENQIVVPAPKGGYMIFDKVTRRGVGISRAGLFNGFREL